MFTELILLIAATTASAYTIGCYVENNPGNTKFGLVCLTAILVFGKVIPWFGY